MVVMEHGAEWPAHVNGGAAGCVALRKEPSESHGELLWRTYERIPAIERIGGGVELAVLSCKDDASVGALERRGPLARALLATVLRRVRHLELVERTSAADRFISTAQAGGGSCA